MISTEQSVSPYLLWPVRLLAYVALAAYLLHFCVRVTKPHPALVVNVLSERAGQFMAYVIVAALAHVDFGAAVLLACCVMSAIAEIETFASITVADAAIQTATATG